MKIFIAGASGFIGSHLVKRLTSTEHDIYCLVRKSSFVEYLEDLGVTLIEGDVTDRDSICRGMEGCQWVVNAANIYSYWEPHIQAYTNVNIKGTQNIMECVLDLGVSKVVHMSTAAVCPEIMYDTGELARKIQASKYNQTKYAGDQIARQLQETRGLPLVMLYLGNVLGPGDPKPTGQHIKNILFRRVRVRAFESYVATYVYVNDVAEAIVKALEKEDNIGETYLIGKYSLSMGEMNCIISKVSGVCLPKVFIPDPLVIIVAKLTTWLANLTKNPPLFGISTDGLRTVQAGVTFDGRKAEEELGLNYTPIQVALEQAIYSFQK